MKHIRQLVLERVGPQELRQAARRLLRNRGFTALAVATLALGIGTSTAVFSVVDTVVFRKLPYAAPERLVKICGNAKGQATDDVSLLDLIDIRDQSRVFEQVAADDGTGFDVTHADGSRESLAGAFVTTNWLSTLGIRPMLGRDFRPEEAEPGRDRVVILMHEYWRRRLRSDPGAVGTTLNVDGDTFTVIGVLPPNVLRYGADFLKPLVTAQYPHDRKHRDLDAFARLKPGVSLTEAQAELETVAKRLERDYPATNKGRGFSLVSLEKYYASVHPRAGHGLMLMLGAVGLVLLIACANVANLLLARAVTQTRDCTIRATLGATRPRLVRELLMETVLLFLAGGAAGIVLARASIDALIRLAVSTDYLPGKLAVHIDGRVLAFSLLACLVTAVGFGLAPALQASRVDLVDGLKGSSLFAGGRRRARRLLIASELALSLVLLVGFGLLVRSFVHLHRQSGGFDPENLVETASDAGRVFAPAVAFWKAAIEHTRTLPGVESAAVSSRPPVHGARAQAFVVEGKAPSPSGEKARAGDILVSSDYFRTMRIPLLKGRAFRDTDDAAAVPVAIVSQSLARRHFGDAEPIGRRLQLEEHSPMTCCAAAGPVEGTWREIVGVVADVRQGNLDEAPADTIYRPYTQIVEHDMYLMVRAHGADDASRLVAGLGPSLRTLDPAKTWWNVRLMRDTIRDSGSVRLRRFVLVLLGGFAALALLLAAVGIYGVTAHVVAQRTREMGIRAALGATRSAILRHVLHETMGLALLGLAAGALAARAGTRFIEHMLFGVGTADVVTYASVSLLLGLVATLGAYFPARRAGRIDPVAALRHE